MAAEAGYEALASKEPEAKPVPYVEVPLEPKPVVVVPAARRCQIRRFCCCLSLATGVRLMAILDFLAGLAGVVVCGLIVFCRTHEAKLDHVVTDGLEHLWGNSTNATLKIAETVAKVNHGVDLAAKALPLMLLAAVIHFYFARVGTRAADGKVKEALLYYYWRAAQFGVSLFSMCFSHIVLAGYAAVVCRSHWLELTKDDLPLHVAVVTTTTTTNKPSPTKTVDAETSPRQGPRRNPLLLKGRTLPLYLDDDDDGSTTM
eukprot:CAMPEP_0197423666 /NCGR_PEP_ID=MMETSP1170-20131217/22076_1 /TAXON_ID=54406 /ORGANISM="Sarcinochrysis sp, Strain CCMP770" /LENGTH=258 /DNA_ID=CAMNT_0042951097 /DNA_START=24 /DNA_END=801 /DNA_ORIENTATION=-